MTVFVVFVAVVTTLLSEYRCCFNIATGSLARKLMFEEQSGLHVLKMI